MAVATLTDQTDWLALSDEAVSEPAWLETARHAAAAHFAQVGLPTLKHEEWRYTSLKQLKAIAFGGRAASTIVAPELPPCAHHRLVFVDGFYRSELSDDVSELGLEVISLRQALEQADDSLASVLGSSLPELNQQHGFTALNTVHFGDGAIIRLSANQVIEQPIECVYLSSGQQTAFTSHIRNLIVAEHHAECTVIERYQALTEGAYVSNAVTEIIAGAGANIDHYKITQEAEQAFHIGGVFIEQARAAQVNTHNIAISGLITRQDIVTNLNGEGAHIEMNGFVLGQAQQHIDNVTQVNHLVPNCTSDELYKTVLDDASRSVFRGRIVVAQDAQLTSAEQQNNSLLLSEHAEADSKPQLEIYADDVKCSHGATVGQLDPKSIFYLNSRGIDAQTARALLTFAFANEVVERIRVEAVRDEMTALLAGELLN